MLDEGELTGLRDGGGAKEEPVDDTEDDDVGGDAEGQGQDGGGSEGGTAAKLAQGVAEVGEEPGHGRTLLRGIGCKCKASLHRRISRVSSGEGPPALCGDGRGRPFMDRDLPSRQTRLWRASSGSLPSVGSRRVRV